MAKLAAAFTYTDAELLALYRECLAALSANQSYSLRGKTLTRADLPHVREMVEWLEGRVTAASMAGRYLFGRHVRSVGRASADIEYR